MNIITEIVEKPGELSKNWAEYIRNLHSYIFEMQKENRALVETLMWGTEPYEDSLE